MHTTEPDKMMEHVALSVAADGSVAQAIAACRPTGNAILRQPDGTVLLAGYDGDSQMYHVLRYSQDGTLDMTFATDGVLSIYAGTNAVAPELELARRAA